MNCPDCGSTSVSVDVGPDVPPTDSVPMAVFRADDGDAIEVIRCCWTCGWRETRVLVVDSVHVDPGDDAAIARERLIGELVDLAAELPTQSLREAVVAVDRLTDPDDESQ